MVDRREAADCFGEPERATAGIGDGAAERISTSLLYSWRRAFQAGLLVSGEANPAFIPARVIAEAWPSRLSDAGQMRGRMEIVLHSGRRVIVDAGVDVAALGRVVAVLERA